ncbi:hypothetical protein FDG2_0736 [Candidatus Protofrankia californiensis]|uniref:Uncharacterized protein n=1 Tax=Candidatus Protofrankia californiensis TaxID=1839754 RepID=A0A1C3NU68_9ACTN|nr:hypothetical protein FDG2_0736 [Candidatus Protofrankia californiensis]
MALRKVNSGYLAKSLRDALDQFVHARLLTADKDGKNGGRVPTVANRWEWLGRELARWRVTAPFPAPSRRFRACGSPAHGSPTSFTAGIR